MKSIKDLIKKKISEGKVLSEDDIESKKSVLSQFLKDMNGKMGNDLKGLKKVTVTSDSPEGLVEGLKKAEDVVDDLPHVEDDLEDTDEDLDDELDDDLEEVEDEDEEDSEADIDAEIAELMAKKEKLRMLRG